MEKKKIAPRKVSSADEQEKALNLLLGKTETIAPKKIKIVAEDDDDAEIDVTPKEKKSVKKAPKAPVKQPRTIRRTAADLLRPTVEVQRVTIDLPIDLYDKLRVETEKSGVTFRFQIISLLKKHFSMD